MTHLEERQKQLVESIQGLEQKLQTIEAQIVSRLEALEVQVQTRSGWSSNLPMNNFWKSTFQDHDL